MAAEVDPPCPNPKANAAVPSVTFSVRKLLESSRRMGDPYKRSGLRSAQTMSRMLELVRTNSLASHQMMTASKGALSVPAEEMVEILVYIAEHNKIMGETARLTLAGWEESSAKAIASNPSSPKEILDYWVSPRNLRPALFPLLLENPSVSNRKLGELASTLKGEWIDAMLSSPRARNSRILLADLNSNKELTEAQTGRAKELLAVNLAVAAPAPIVLAQAAAAAPAVSAAPANVAPASPAADPVTATAAHPAVGSEADPNFDPKTEEVLTAFLNEHASEIAAEGDKPFQPIGHIYEEAPAPTEAASMAAASAAAAFSAHGSSVAAVAPALSPVLPQEAPAPEIEKRGSVLQKINKLDVRGRIQLAMKGNKEERSILVRDGTKIVAIAVLDSPKISDGEVEKFAGQKNVLEAVLRAIPLKRRFMKNYPVVRNLVFNPRTPLDLSLGLMKNLLIADLKNLMGNKEVADTIRKMAMRTYKQKADQVSKK
jgi:hypothetical protein